MERLMIVRVTSSVTSALTPQFSFIISSKYLNDASKMFIAIGLNVKTDIVNYLYSLLSNQMGSIPIAFITSLSVLALVSKEPLNLAYSVLRGIDYLFMKSDTLKKYSKGITKKGQSSSKETNEMEFSLLTLTARLIPALPFASVFKNMWTAFLTVVCSSVVCFVLGYLPFGNLDKQTNWFSVVFMVGLVIAVRFGMIVSSNRKLHRRFSFVYALAWGLISFFSLRNFELGMFDIRPVIHHIVDIPSIVVDSIISVLIGLIASALSTTMLYELFARKSMSAIIPNVLKFDTIARWFISLSDKTLSFWKFVYNIGGLLPILTLLGARFASKYVSYDWIIIVAFCVLEVAISIFKLKCVHLKTQFCTHSGLGAAVAFNSNRTVEAGRLAHATLERSALMAPVAALALSLQPMIVIMASCGVFCSFVMSGIWAVAVRSFCLFLVGFGDLCMMGYRVVGLFLGYDN